MDVLLVYSRLVRCSAVVIAACLTCRPANAGDPFGFYIGGSVGQSHLSEITRFESCSAVPMDCGMRNTFD
jgi:hypothetical protein